MASMGHEVTVLYTIDKEPPKYSSNVHLIEARLAMDEEREALAGLFWNQTVSSTYIPFVYLNGNLQLGRLMDEYGDKVGLLPALPPVLSSAMSYSMIGPSDTS